MQLKNADNPNTCSRCGRIATDLSAHYGEYKLCRGCWRVHREVVKIYGEMDIGEFQPSQEGAV